MDMRQQLKDNLAKEGIIKPGVSLKSIPFTLPVENLSLLSNIAQPILRIEGLLITTIDTVFSSYLAGLEVSCTCMSHKCCMSILYLCNNMCIYFTFGSSKVCTNGLEYIHTNGHFLG